MSHDHDHRHNGEISRKLLVASIATGVFVVVELTVGIAANSLGLAGDALQALAFQTIAEDEKLAPALRIQLVAEVARASGVPAGMVAGQACRSPARRSCSMVGGGIIAVRITLYCRDAGPGRGASRSSGAGRRVAF